MRPSATAEEMDFHGLSIRFDSRVLRPRPWTAAQSWWAADLSAELPDGPILELCAGAGQIGMLAARASGRDLVCVERDAVAAAYCRSNAERAGMADRVEVRHDDLLAALRPAERFPLIVADPPWVRAAETGGFPEDPLSAIDGGPCGLDVARRCLSVISDHLEAGGSALVQLGDAAQAASLHGCVTGLGLIHGEVREYGDHGVVFHIHR